MLWLPVLFACGIGGYFALSVEPDWWWLALLALCCMGLLLWRARLWWPIAAMGVGLVWASICSHYQAVTPLEKEMNWAEISGRIIEIADVPKGYRITLDEVAIKGVAPEKTPERVRLKLRGTYDDLISGQHISLRGGLLPAAGPVMPHAFDFSRFFFFRDIGAVGYGLPPVKVLKGQDEGWDGLLLTRARAKLSRRIRAQLPPEEGAVAAALMTGDRSAISERVNEMMRTTNLSHILAISGMHMALVTGMIFLVLRYGLVRVAWMRHRRHLKKIAAATALVCGALYLLMSGMPISAVRAFVMVCLLLGAVLIDRTPAPMRSLAVAAMLLLIYDPSNLLEPGFQLSFAATVALIAWYESLRRHADDAMLRGQWSKRAMLYLGGVLMTSLVAEFATAPLVLYHFNSISFYGMIANMVVMPLVSFLIMPMLVLAALLMPLGLEWLPLQVAGYGIHWMILVAEWTAALPFSQIYVASFSLVNMVLFALGALWLMIWQRRVRYAGVVLMVLAVVILRTDHLPQLLISKDMKQIAAEVDGQMMLLRGRSNGFVAEQWANGLGEKSLPVYKANEAQDNVSWRCDALGCVYRLGDKQIAFPEQFSALPQDCTEADLVIANIYMDDPHCKDAIVIDRKALAHGGSHWLWLDGDEMRMGNSAAEQGARLWGQQSIRQE